MSAENNKELAKLRAESSKNKEAAIEQEKMINKLEAVN